MPPNEPDKRMGEKTREAVAFFLQQLCQITGVRHQESLVTYGILALCAFSVASGHDMPEVVRQALVTMSESPPARRPRPEHASPQQNAAFAHLGQALTAAFGASE